MLSRKARSVVALVTLAFAALVYLLAWSSIFTVSAVKVTGAPSASSKAHILKVAGIALNQKLARVEPRSVEATIKSIEWVDHAHISRNWISGEVDIEISPRIPVAFYNGHTIDRTGTVFTLPGLSDSSLPQVSALKPELGLRAISLFKSLPQSFRESVTSLVAVDELNFQLNISYKGRAISVMWGRDEKSALKIEVFNALMALKENARVTRIDLSAPHAPLVK